MTQQFSATAAPQLGALIQSFLGPFNFEPAVLGASQSVVPGTILGRVTASGQVVVLAPAASDGSQTFYGIAAEVRTTAAGETCVINVLETGPAELAEQALIYPSGASAPQRATIRAAILAKQFKLR